MNNLNLSTFGFDMYKVPTRDGSTVYEIDTPFLLADEYNLYIFVEKIGNHIHIFDEGCTMFDMRGLGIDFDDGRLNSFSRLLKSWNLGLDGTSIESFETIERAPILFSKYIAAMMSIDNWLRSNLQVRPSRQNLINQAKTYFKTWTRIDSIVDKPTIKGKYGNNISFDFSVDDIFVDSIFPEYNSTASFMHKVALAKITQPIKTLVVVDDTNEPDKAKKETEVVSVMSTAMFLSTLKSNAVNGRPFYRSRYASFN